MKTRKRKIEIGIVSDVANFRRKIIIGLATLLMGIFVLPASAQCEAIVSICWLWAVSGRISSLKCGIR